MSLKQVRTLALAATLLAGTTALAYAQSGSSPPEAGSSPAKHTDSTMGAGSSSGTNGEMKKGEEGKSSSMKKGEEGKSSAMKKGEENKSSAMKNEPGKSTSGKAETSKDAASKNAEQGKSATSNTGKSAAENNKAGTRTNTTNSTMNKSGQSDTTGKGGNAPTANSTSANAGANVNLTTQQKSEIKSTVIDSKSAPRVSHVDFNVSVGTVIPTTVHFARVPETIVRIHPAWRDYDYFVYNDEVIIIEPHTRKIVEIIVVS